MSRSTVWVVIKIQTFSASLMRDNTVFNATSKESVLAVICWCSRDNITPAIKSLSLFLAYFQSVVRRMHAGCLFVFFMWKWLLPPARIETGEKYLWQTSHRNHSSLWVRLNFADLASEFCALPEAVYPLKVSILSPDAQKKRDIFLPIAICMTYNTTYPRAGEG